MTTDQMKSFLEAAKTLNFTAAAEALFITQPTLSRQIANIERELGVQLFVRLNNSVALTGAGRELYQGLSKIYGDYTDLTERVKRIGSGVSGLLRIAIAEEYLMNPVILNGVQKISRNDPNITIEVSRMNYKSMHSMLVEGTIDLCDALYNEKMDYINMKKISVQKEKACLAVHKTLIQECISEGITDVYDPKVFPVVCKMILDKVPLTLFPASNFGREDVDHPLEEFVEKVHIPGLKPRMINAENVTGISLYVSSGLAVTAVSENNILKHDPDVVFLPIPGHPDYTRAVVYNPGNHNKTLQYFLKNIGK